MRCTAVFLIGLAAAGSALGGACGGPAAKPRSPASQTADGARQDAKAVVDEGYRALKSGDTDDLLSLLSDEVVVIGPGPGDVMRSRADAVLALREVIDSRKKTRFASASLRLTIAAGGRSAYAVDRLTVGGKAVVAAALLDGAAATWRVTAVALAPPVSAAAAKKAAAAGTLTAPAATGGEVPIGDGGAGPTKALASGLEDVASWVSTLADEPDAVVIGADGAVASGKKAIERAAKQWRAVEIEPSSAIASVVTGDGKLALVTCLAQRQVRAEKPEPTSSSGKSGKAKAPLAKKPAKPAALEAPRTVRVTVILKNAGGETWQLAMFQEASAVAAK